MSEVDEIQREIVQTQQFVRDRFDPLTRELTLVREEQDRLAGEVRRVLEQERAARRESVLRRASNDRLRVRGGKLDGFDLVDMAITRSLLAAQQAAPTNTTRACCGRGRRASRRQWTRPLPVPGTSSCPRKRRASCGPT